MADLIDRQAAIDAIWSHLRNILKKVNFKDSDYDGPVRDAYKMAHQHLAEVIESLPSAEPEVLACGSGDLVQEPDSLVQDLVQEPEIVRCKDCKYWNSKQTECEGIGHWFGLVDEWSPNGFCYKGERRTDE